MLISKEPIGVSGTMHLIAALLFAFSLAMAYDLYQYKPLKIEKMNNPVIDCTNCINRYPLYEWRAANKTDIDLGITTDVNEPITDVVDALDGCVWKRKGCGEAVNMPAAKIEGVYNNEFYNEY